MVVHVEQKSPEEPPAPGARRRGRPGALALVARGFGVPTWPRAFAAGRVVGLNDPFAYGYHRAADEGVDVAYSRDDPEGALGRLGRLGMRAALGFDLVHAWRNRALIDAADVVWTHTESQSLAVCALRVLRPRAPRPKLLMQSVWLVDSWERFSRPRRALYRRLLARADVLSFHTGLASTAARRIFPNARVETVHFGVAIDARSEPEPPRFGDTLHVVAVGNDRHRDWATLVAAFGSRPGVLLRIVSRTAPERLIRAHANVERVVADDDAALVAALDGADLAVVPLRENLHASGITVLQELALRGIPAIVTRTGGLPEYFDDDAVWYVPPGDAAALRETAAIMRADPERCLAKARRAARRMGANGLSSTAYARRHAELSLDLLGERSMGTAREDRGAGPTERRDLAVASSR